MRKKSTFWIILWTLVIPNVAFAQHIGVGSPLEQHWREKQLIDSSIKSYSFTIRPIQFPIVSPDSLEAPLLPQLLDQDLLSGKFYLQPLNLDLQFNSYRPFGWNNGSMITAKGLQYRLSAGLQYRSKFFEANLQPEFVQSANRVYRFSTQFGFPTKGPYSKIFLGQSYAEFKLWKLALGFSNENIWLGPGQNSALIVSNNAPGFGHLYFSTQKPIRTPVFDIEFKAFGGGLDQDSLLNSEAAYQKPAVFQRQWRYLSGITMTLQPKFIPGLYVGFNRAVQFYGNKEDSSTVGFFNKYLPAVSAFFKKKINTQEDAPREIDGQDQVASVFMRFVLPKEHMEFYFEYGYNDFKANTRDLIQDVQHSSAYLVGFKKIVPTSKRHYYSVFGELVQMAQSSGYIVRNSGNWYTVNNGAIRQGMTHMNQVLGSGSGLGNNVQSLHVERVNKLERMGLKIMRIQNDPRGILKNPTTGLLNPVSNVWLNELSWTDIVYGPTLQLNLRQFLLRGEVLFVHSKNYAWLPENTFNIHASFNLIYKW